MDISKSLVELRKKIGMRQTEAARQVGITQTYMSQIEGGKKDPSTEVLKKICAVYGISPSIMYFMAMTVDDVHKSKRRAFTELKPLIDNLINQFI